MMPAMPPPVHCMRARPPAGRLPARPSGRRYLRVAGHFRCRPLPVPPMRIDKNLLALYVPKLVTILRAGYGMADFRRDAMAGLTVSIVALPLSMALAIASGTSPDKGLHTAIIAGFMISALGGSRVQIGGP